MTKTAFMNTISYELNVMEDRSWMYVRVYDPVTRVLALDLLKDAVEQAKKHGAYNFLIDARGVPSMKSTIEDYDIVNYRLPELGFERRSKGAVIVDPDDRSHDFFETCTINAGYNWRIFTDADLASQWLSAV